MNLKERILQVAYECFAKKGYEQTTVQEIIIEAGASKGGFYHHFRSKEEILEAIIESYIQNITEIYQVILKDELLSFQEKFTGAMIKINQYKADKVDDWPKMKRVFEFQGNHVLLIKLAERFEWETRLFYCELINNSNREGLTHVRYPDQLASLWSREVIRFQRMARKVYMNDGSVTEQEYGDMLAFSEMWINQVLGNQDLKISLMEIGKSYIVKMRKQIDELEGLR
jgi:AcrR family transcriptional regulator